MSSALLIAAALDAGTILALASLGLLINEKAGILNLGAEGMMLCAALAGFATVVHTGSAVAGFAAGMVVGGAVGRVLWGAGHLVGDQSICDRFGIESLWSGAIGVCGYGLRAREIT